MVCIKMCSLATVFLVSMVYMAFIIDKDAIMKPFMNSLTFQQREKYKTLIEERRMLYLKGYGIGLVLTACYLLWNYLTNTIDRPRSNVAAAARAFIRNPLSIACVAVVICSLTTYFYYTLTPKSDYMILHLDNKDQREKWLAVYKKMMYNYHISYVLGIVAVFFGSYALKW